MPQLDPGLCVQDRDLDWDLDLWTRVCAHVGVAASLTAVVHILRFLLQLPDDKDHGETPPAAIFSEVTPICDVGQRSKCVFIMLRGGSKVMHVLLLRQVASFANAVDVH